MTTEEETNTTSFKDKLTEKYNAFKAKLTPIFFHEWSYGKELKIGWQLILFLFSFTLAGVLLVTGVNRYDQRHREETWQHNRDTNQVITVLCDHRMVQMNFGQDGNDEVRMSNPETVRKYEGYYVEVLPRGIGFYLIDRNHHIIEFVNVGCIVTNDRIE